MRNIDIWTRCQKKHTNTTGMDLLADFGENWRQNFNIRSRKKYNPVMVSLTSEPSESSYRIWCVFYKKKELFCEAVLRKCPGTFWLVLSFILDDSDAVFIIALLQTPSELGDTALQSRSGGQTPTDSNEIHAIKPMELHWEIWTLTLPIVFGEVYLRAQMEFGGAL